MPPSPVIKALDPRKHRCSCLLVGPEALLAQQLALQGRKEAFHHGMVKAVADGSHRRVDPHRRTPLSKAHGGVTFSHDPSDESAPLSAAASPPPSPELPPQPTPGWDLEQALGKLGIREVAFDNANGNLQGWSHGVEFAINPVAVNRTKTTFHEIGHIVLGHTIPARHEEYATHRGIGEFQAEAVAYLAMNELGRSTMRLRSIAEDISGIGFKTSSHQTKRFSRCLGRRMRYCGLAGLPHNLPHYLTSNSDLLKRGPRYSRGRSTEVNKPVF